MLTQQRASDLGFEIDAHEYVERLAGVADRSDRGGSRENVAREAIPRERRGG